MVKIIDTHVHSWDLLKAKPGWLTEETGLIYDNFLPEDLETVLPETGVQEGILVQADNTIQDSLYLFEKARTVEWIKGVVAWLPLSDPKETLRLITEHYKKETFFKGVRHLMHIETDNRWILNEKVMESLQLLARFQIPFDAIGINLEQLDAIISVAERIPGLSIVIDHLNQPPLEDEYAFCQWSEKMKIAAQHDNMHVKISGLGNIKRPSGVDLEEAIKPTLDVVFTQFGTERVFCGGDWPICLLDRDYSSTWKAYTHALSHCITNHDLLEEVTFWNGKRFYHT